MPSSRSPPRLNIASVTHVAILVSLVVLLVQGNFASAEYLMPNQAAPAAMALTSPTLTVGSTTVNWGEPICLSVNDILTHSTYSAEVEMVYDRGFSVTYKEALANNNGNTYGPYDNKLFFDGELKQTMTRTQIADGETRTVQSWFSRSTGAKDGGISLGTTERLYTSSKFDSNAHPLKLEMGGGKVYTSMAFYSWKMSSCPPAMSTPARGAVPVPVPDNTGTNHHHAGALPATADDHAGALPAAADDHAGAIPAAAYDHHRGAIPPPPTTTEAPSPPPPTTTTEAPSPPPATTTEAPATTTTTEAPAATTTTTEAPAATTTTTEAPATTTEAPAGPQQTMSASLRLTGVTESTFDAASFKQGMAAVLKVSKEAITIKQVKPWSTARRMLLATEGVDVDFTVSAATDTNLAFVYNTVLANGSLLSSLTSAGVSATKLAAAPLTIAPVSAPTGAPAGEKKVFGDDKKSSSDNMPIIIGVVVAIALALVAGVGAMLWLRRRDAARYASQASFDEFPPEKMVKVPVAAPPSPLPLSKQIPAEKKP
ncbi:hypothetical protein RI054_14g70200 [Pseudoscourfieldia marina]